MSLATPAGYEPNADIVEQAQAFAESFGAEIEITNDPHDAVIAANAVYTDVWTSMGQESEAAERKAIFADYQVDEEPTARRARTRSLCIACRQSEGRK